MAPHRPVALAICLLLSLSATICIVHASGGGGEEENVDESDVLVLTKANFDSIVNAEELMLVEFFAPWCGHCKHLKPEYAKAATMLKANNPPIKLAKVDATAETDLASKFDVHGYPSLFVTRNGKRNEYKGPREAQGIADYMKKQVGPSAKPLSSAEEVTSFTAVNAQREFVVVGFLADKTSQLYSSFMAMAGRLRDDFSFGIVTDATVAKEAGFAEDAVVAFKNYDDKQTPYKGKSKSKDLEAWVLQQSFPLVGEFKADKAPLYSKRGLPVAKYYMRVDWSAANEKHTKFFVSRLQQAATEFLDRVVVTVANASAFAHELDALGWKDKEKEKNWEGGLVVEREPNQKFKYTGKFSAQNVKQFIADVLDGKVELYIKSEPKPASNDGPVTIVVGKTFSEVVADDKDVMIELYAPWCGHCKALEPKYTKLGEKFKGSPSLVIAKMDATANDAPPEYQVRGFPTLYFKPAGGKPMKFEGDREVEAMAKFIKEHAKNPVSGAKKGKKKKSKDSDL